jgi:hypothetical protein
MKPQHYMLDIEMVGHPTDAAPAPLEIAWVRFDEDPFVYRSCAVDVHSAVKAGCTQATETWMWWMRQDKAAKDRIVAGQDGAWQLPAVLMRMADRIPADSILWARGVDWQWVQAYFRVCGLRFPWKYGNVRDVRTICALAPEVTVPNVGVSHSALDDCMYQINHLNAVLAVLKLELR